MTTKTRQQMLEEKVMEACVTLETWYHGGFSDDRAALRQLRALLKPVGEMLASESPE